MEFTAAFLYEDLLVSQLSAPSYHIHINIQLKRDVSYKSICWLLSSKLNWLRVPLAGDLWLAVPLSGVKIMDY